MDLFLLVGSSPYFCFIVIIISGLLFRVKQPTDISSNLPFVSVVIAARNEEANISNLLDDLVKQNIDKNNFEVIVSNDRSEDNTKEIQRIPAEIWRFNEKEVTKVFIKDKVVKNIKLDPFKETADVNLEDNNFPRVQIKSDFDRFNN